MSAILKTCFGNVRSAAALGEKTGQATKLSIKRAATAIHMDVRGRDLQ